MRDTPKSRKAPAQRLTKHSVLPVIWVFVRGEDEQFVFSKERSRLPRDQGAWASAGSFGGIFNKEPVRETLGRLQVAAIEVGFRDKYPWQHLEVVGNELVAAISGGKTRGRLASGKALSRFVLLTKKRKRRHDTEAALKGDSLFGAAVNGRVKDSNKALVLPTDVLKGDLEKPTEEVAELHGAEFGKEMRRIAKTIREIGRAIEPLRREIADNIEGGIRTLGHVTVASAEEGQAIAMAINDLLQREGVRFEVKAGIPGYVMYDPGGRGKTPGFYVRAVIGRDKQSLSKTGFAEVRALPAPPDQRRKRR